MVKTGRPRKSPEEKRSEPIPVVYTAAEKAEIEAAAEVAGADSVSSWIRTVLLKAARRLNGKPKG
jgi:hypothetical protein